MRGFLKVFFMLAGSEVFPHVDFNPGSAADVLMLLDYIASQTGRTYVHVAVASDGVIVWRHNRDFYPVGGVVWRQSAWVAKTFQRPGFPIEVGPMDFRLGVDAIGVGRIW